jgi:DeoR/GlpR family transcriptional regulator of sugar metabolism
MSKAKNYYADDFLEKQRSYYANLPEKQRRHFLAMEYERLGRGSKRYLARVFGCARQTIRKGVRELSAQNYEADYTRQRVAGGGRKKKKPPLPNSTT